MSNGFKVLYRLPKALGSGEHMGGYPDGGDEVTVMVPFVGLCRFPADALEVVVPDVRPELVATMPELMFRVVAAIRATAEGIDDEDTAVAATRLARVIEVAAHQWDHLRSPSSRPLAAPWTVLLEAVGEQAKTLALMVCDPPVKLAGSGS